MSRGKSIDVTKKNLKHEYDIVEVMIWGFIHSHDVTRVSKSLVFNS